MDIKTALESAYTWLIGGGLSLIVTSVLTAVITRNKKKKWQAEAKLESFEDLLVGMSNLMELVKFQTDIFIKVFSTSKAIPTEIKLDIENQLNEMKKKAIFRLSAASEELLEYSKEKRRRALAKSQELVTKVADETNEMIANMKAATTKAVGELLK